MTDRQYDTWEAWFEDEEHRPSKMDRLVAQVAIYAKIAVSKSGTEVSLDEMLEVITRRPKTVTVMLRPDGSLTPESEAELRKRDATAAIATRLTDDTVVVKKTRNEMATFDPVEDMRERGRRARAEKDRQEGKISIAQVP